MSINWHEVKPVAEAFGASMSVASLFLTGAGRKSGPWIGIAAGAPWVAFAVATQSWLMVLQTVITIAVHLINLRRGSRLGMTKAAHVPA